MRILQVVFGVSCILGLMACGSSDDDGGGTSQGGSGGTGQGGTSNGGGNQGGSNNGGGNQGGGNQGGSNNGGGNQGGSGGGSQCYGDFTLGQNFVTSGDMSTLGAKCNSAAPTNCPDGTFINIAETGDCYCLVMCSSLQGVQQGDKCSTDGAWMCEKIQATNPSANTATVCVPTQWGLCTAGGGGGSGGGGQGGSGQGGGNQGGSGGGGQGGGSQGGSGGGSCSGSGAECFDDEECCSGTCDNFECQ